MSEQSSIVIIGGGHAGAQLCGALFAGGYSGAVHLVCEDSELPYHRPPLSKSYLKTPTEGVKLLRPEAWFTKAGVTLHRKDPAVAIDRPGRTVRLCSGSTLRYDTLVLAMGARPRRLPHLPEGLSNVAVLRSAADASQFREQLQACETVTVLGGGFIGLEIAAVARALGKSVQVLESAARLLGRSISPEMSTFITQAHRESGIDVRVGVAVGEFEISGNRLVALGVDRVLQPVDLMVQGIGAAPEHQLATDAGLHCTNGIVVDAHMRTSDPAILAIGDCTNFPQHGTGRRMRLESVQNANDQARTAFSTISGTLEPYRALPWFWSDQGALRLQIVGLMPEQGVRMRRDGAAARCFSILHYAAERLVCVESLNAPADHLAARKLLESGLTVPPELACDPAVALNRPP